MRTPDDINALVLIRVGKRLENCVPEAGQLRHVESGKIERFCRKKNEIRRVSLEQTSRETRQLVGFVRRR